MAFLEDLDKKLTMLGQGAIQKTKEMTDSAKLLSVIKNLEMQQKEEYAELGILFYKEYKEKNIEVVSPAVIDSVKKIGELEGQIIIKKEEVLKVKGTIFCPNCNTEIPDNSLFCNVCGAKIENQNVIKLLKERNEKICSGCGTSLEEDQQFCINCGTPVGQEVKVSDKAFTSMQVSPESNVVPETNKDNNVCERCGAILEPEQEFCVMCGTPVKKEMIEKENQDHKNICENCGKKVPQEMRFCTSCGTPINF